MCSETNNADPLPWRLAPGVMLTTHQVAPLLCRTPEATEKLRRRGGGPAYVREGGRILYRSEDVIAYLDSLPRFVPGASS